MTSVMTSPPSTLSFSSPSSVSSDPYLSTTAFKDIDATIREFWAAFPCPPPWKPHLLVEINSTRLDPEVSKTVQTFLAGKCDIQHILLSPDAIPNPGVHHSDLYPTDDPDLGSSLSDQPTSESKRLWCDVNCQVWISCAVIVVVIAMLVIVVACITKHRLRYKMASTRPSRQQLQLSSSISDAAINCTDFSNLEIQGDDEIIYPPFRHRGLPNLPTACHPSCDPGWNCPNCSSCHPLMRMSPSENCCRPYSGVYETIDDEEDEDVQRTDTEPNNEPRGRNSVITDPRNSYHSCSSCQTSPTGVSTVQIRHRNRDDARASQVMAETVFNGEENLENGPRLPKYFELEYNCALAGIPQSLPHGCRVINPTTAHSRACMECQQFPIHPVSYQYPHLAGTPLHSYVMSQVQHTAMPPANELYRVRSGQQNVRNSDAFPEMEHQPPTGDPLVHNIQGSDETGLIGAGHQAAHTNCGNAHNYHHPPYGWHPTHFNPVPSHPHHSAATSTFEPDIPRQIYCSSCQQNNPSSTPCTQQEMTSHSHLGECQSVHQESVAPDLLNEASNHNHRRSQVVTTPTSPSDTNVDSNEVPLRKPVLALHSRYFAKTSAA